MSSSQQLDDEDDYYEGLPVDVKRAIQGLRGLQVAQVGIQKEFQKEILALERKYSKSMQVLYERRKQVLLGKIGVSKEEIILGEVQSLKEDEDYRNLPALPVNTTTSRPAKVEGFWLRVLKGQPDIENMIQETDEPALYHLTDMTVSYPTKLSGPGDPSLAFSVNFYFSPNEFFSNSVLTKTYVYKACWFLHCMPTVLIAPQDEIGFFGQLLYSHVTADTIRWKSGKDLIKVAEEEAKKLKDDSDEEDSDSDKDDDGDDDDDMASFFKFFCPSSRITRPEDDAKVNVTGASEEDDRDVLLEEDFDIGEALKDQARMLRPAFGAATNEGNRSFPGQLTTSPEMHFSMSWMTTTTTTRTMTTRRVSQSMTKRKTTSGKGG
ncbi:NAP-domain-containing protein [Heliocybe sulcata]|uniref:NAP-domain-containing protein n=1 Tax=Heliocybe sulcata TaxID=5364 RepID=A0A5C3MWQ8_9AGAM|nr:NAP-domain-containing protein [Heliocybe sulcata]